MAPRDPDRYRRARLLRQHGTPFKRIAAKLGISVATAHAWTRDVELTPEQHARNLRGPRGPRSAEAIAKFARTWSEKNRHRRRMAQAEGREHARLGDPCHQAGCMLYWAEGSKTRSVTFSNSDLEMVKVFVRFLRECLGVRDERMTIRLNVYVNNGLTLREIEDHWLWGLGLPRSSLRKHSINHRPTSSSGRKVNKLPYGVCTLGVRKSMDLLQHIYGAIQEYAGFDEPRWLDGPPRKPRSSR